MPDAHKAAAQAQQNTALRAVARVGFVALGMVHLLIGVIALTLAFGGSGSGDQQGAMATIAGAPAGAIALWIAAIALWGLAVWSIVDGFLVKHRESDDKKGWTKRIGAWGRSVSYIVAGTAAASVAMGARSDSDQSAKSASSDVLHLPGGPFVLGAVGVVIGAIGVSFVVKAFTRKFLEDLSVPDPKARKTVAALGVIGHVAEGVALLLVGGLFVAAAIRVDPSQAGGTDAALKALLGTPFGPWAVGAIGVGLIAYGLFCATRAKYDRL